MAHRYVITIEGEVGDSAALDKLVAGLCAVYAEHEPHIQPVVVTCHTEAAAERIGAAIHAGGR